MHAALRAESLGKAPWERAMTQCGLKSAEFHVLMLDPLDQTRGAGRHAQAHESRMAKVVALKCIVDLDLI